MVRSGRCLPAQRDHTVALRLRKHPDVCLFRLQPQLALQPEVGRPLVRVAAAAHGIQRLMGLHPLTAQAGVGEGAHWAMIFAVGGYIRIAHRPAGAAVDVIALSADRAAKDAAGRDADGTRPAVGTGDFIDHGVSLLCFRVLLVSNAARGQSDEETVRHRMASA